MNIWCKKGHLLMSFRFLSAKSDKPKKPKKTKKTKKPTQVLPRTAPPWFCFFCFFVFFGFFGTLFFFGFCFFLCFLSCRRFLCVGAMSARGLSSCICQRSAWIDMHFMCILRTLVVPCSEKIPLGSMYGIFSYISSMFMVNVGKYTIHGSYGIWRTL